MKKFMIGLLFTVLSTTSVLCALEKCDQVAISNVIEHIKTVWNEHEGHGFADDYTQDADFVNIFGMAFSGKQEIETRHVKILETFLKGSVFEMIDVELREVRPDVVIAHVFWKVSNIQKPGNETMKGIFTHVLLKNGDKWEITATQNTLTSN